MTPRDRLKQRVQELRRKGCTPDRAFQLALREQDVSTVEKSKLLNTKHEIELEMALEEGVSEKKRVRIKMV